MNTHLGRYQNIAEILARQGLGFLVDVTGMDRWVPFRRSAAVDESANRTAERLRLALEELGPTFIKLGQLLSTRPDLLPSAYITELAKLQDSAPPVPVGEVLAAIRSELGADGSELFAEFDPQPLASASIGQAQAGVLHDGTPVVVKVRRPGIVRQVEEDLDILQNLATRASRRWELVRGYDVTGIAQEFAITLRAELDYLQEGRNAEHFAEAFAADRHVTIPRVFWDTTTSRVLTLERVGGINISDLSALEAAGIDRRRLARRGTDIILKMIFEDRFFHADPHPGNMFVQPDGGIALIDFGMVGRVDERLQEQLADFLIAFTAANPDGLATALWKLSVTKDLVDRDGLRQSLAGFVSQYDGRPLSEVNFAHLLTQLLTTLRVHHLQLPRQLALLFKVLIMVEGTGAHLDPGFTLGEVLNPYARRLVQDRLSIDALAKRLVRASSDAGELLVELPGRTRRVLEILDTTGMQVHLRAAELEPLVERVDRVGTRLVAGMITAALINGVGGIVMGDRKWRSWGAPLLRAGVTVVGILSGFLVWTARRRRP
jgi:ubiquinone biosynthesis protein